MNETRSWPKAQDTHRGYRPTRTNEVRQVIRLREHEESTFPKRCLERSCSPRRVLVFFTSDCPSWGNPDQVERNGGQDISLKAIAGALGGIERM
ncbi:hypothetical protein EI42_05672 [Thermosporothrix hazakensis]|jgi:hypothetical protein|uniref:Uncharacterized protein n=1 Tax=Thermosporothrix hazakensis TaxID=644383 RepID=A0A326TW57_THEHA|nr:hypothetical protein [Thermosporothrix hazakensis]PZW21136.1 hypothetical protein EI42_05672 [Thermosporothrix hazakensis]GCE50695.1 hypothetical protein KTH_55640 [Thermosporothrix hazakensis]